MADRRIRKTRAALKSALIELINEVGFDCITVNDICDRADINRGTFYLHYQDKFELIERVENEIIEGIQNTFTQVMTDDVTLLMQNIQNPPIMLIEHALKCISDNIDFFRTMQTGKGRYDIFIKLQNAFEKFFKRIIFSGEIGLVRKQPSVTIPEKFALAFLLGGISSIIEAWIKNEAMEPPKEIALMILKIRITSPLELLGFDLANNS